MNLLSINPHTFVYRAYAILGRKRVMTKEATFNQALEADDTEKMRVDPVAFISELTYVPPPEPAPKPPVALVGFPPDFEPGVA